MKGLESARGEASAFFMTGYLSKGMIFIEAGVMIIGSMPEADAIAHLLF